MAAGVLRHGRNETRSMFSKKIESRVGSENEIATKKHKKDFVESCRLVFVLDGRLVPKY
jgi:hypothetical protein